MRKIVPKRRGKATHAAKTDAPHYRVYNALYSGPLPLDAAPDEETKTFTNAETGRVINVTFVYWPPVETPDPRLAREGYEPNRVPDNDYREDEVLSADERDIEVGGAR
jgi:hypothetical protein